MPETPDTPQHDGGPLPPFSGRPSTDAPSTRRHLGIVIVAGVCAVAVIVAILLATIVPRRRALCAARATAPAVDTLAEITSVTVKSGEILPSLLLRGGVSSVDVGRVVPALRNSGFNLRTMRPGDSVSILRKDSTLRRILYHRNYENVYCVDVDSGACRVSMLLRRIRRESALVQGDITSSLYESLVALGETPALIADYTDMFGWEVDFFSETQAGDSFMILVERKYADTVFVGYGSILAARYKGQVGTFEGYRFVDADGHADCYNREGQSLRKTFLKTPLRFSRVSSFFGRRFHPILRRVRQHSGIDYVAPTGTPVDCVADGRVISAGWSGGYGRLVVVGHADGYQTRYGHLSRFGKGVRAGTPAVQGQVIGYVGTTGLSTGSHLHYEVRKNGSAVNPLKLNPPRAAPVKLAYLPQFNATRDSLDSLIKSLAHRVPQPPAQTRR
jgi:murein DD-endopeptidase MepM/ murein hydrolase activator NlpD